MVVKLSFDQSEDIAAMQQVHFLWSPVRACKEDGKSVATHKTLAGLQEADWRKGLKLYRNA
jgi:hypothetical protein